MSANASKPMGIRRVQIARESDLPTGCAATPGMYWATVGPMVITNESDIGKYICLLKGGTMFGTTPGGSKIIYDRLYLLKVRDSPASHVSVFTFGKIWDYNFNFQTPPVRLPAIPGVTCPKVPKTEESGDGDAKPVLAASEPIQPAENSPEIDNPIEMELN